jgi:hypothetical protein
MFINICSHFILAVFGDWIENSSCSIYRSGCIITAIYIKAMKEKSKYKIPHSEPETGASPAGDYTERSSGASS